jgi:PBP1b-binding outer membrane lipoprotein LpoB
MTRRPLLLTALACGAPLLAAGCVGQLTTPTSGARRVDPRDEDHLAGTALTSGDLLAAARFVSDSLRTALPAREGQRWLVAMKRTINDSSLDIDCKLVTTQIVAGANRDPERTVDFILDEAEELAKRLREEQENGSRRGDSPPGPLLVPDYLLTGSIREHALNSRLGLSRYVQIEFTASDTLGRVVWSDIAEFKKVESRHEAYR